MGVSVELYKELIEKLNPENYEKACIYAKTKQELVTKFKEYMLKECDTELDEEFLYDIIEFEGQGFYDYAGRNFDADSIMLIDTILKNELEAVGCDLEIFTNPKSFVKKYKENTGCKYIYPVFGVIHVRLPITLSLMYIVKSNKKLSEYDIFSILEENGIEPYAYGTHVRGQWANFYIAELEELDSDDLYLFVTQNPEEIFNVNNV